MYSCNVYTKDDLQSTNVKHSLYKTNVKLPITLDILKVTIIIQLYKKYELYIKDKYSWLDLNEVSLCYLVYHRVIIYIVAKKCPI